MTTETLPPEARYDFWRHAAYYSFDADAPTAAQRTDFRAWGAMLIAPECDFVAFRSDAVSGKRRRADIQADGGESVTVGLVLAGERAYAFDDGVTGTARAGELFVYDAARPSQVAWSAHEGVHLTIPRRLAQSAMSPDLPPPSRISAALSVSPSARYLASHLAMMAGEAAALPPRDQAALLESAKHLLLSVLWSAAGPDRDEETRRHHGVLRTARRFIDARLHDPDLNVAMIGGAAGCSRATLYRAFAQAGLTVAGYIREQRLQRARRFIELSRAKTPISAVAAQCGFLDTANFSRLFRQRFGLPPSEARRQARAIVRQAAD